LPRSSDFGKRHEVMRNTGLVQQQLGANAAAGAWNDASPVMIQDRNILEVDEFVCRSFCTSTVLSPGRLPFPASHIEPVCRAGDHM